MDVVPQKRTKPTAQEVKLLQDMYPRLDYLMAETLLWFTDDPLILLAITSPQTSRHLAPALRAQAPGVKTTPSHTDPPQGGARALPTPTRAPYLTGDTWVGVNSGVPCLGSHALSCVCAGSMRAYAVCVRFHQAGATPGATTAGGRAAPAGPRWPPVPLPLYPLLPPFPPPPL